MKSFDKKNLIPFFRLFLVLYFLNIFNKAHWGCFIPYVTGSQESEFFQFNFCTGRTWPDFNDVSCWWI